MFLFLGVFFLLYYKDDLSHHKSAAQTPIYSGESVPLYQTSNAVDRNPTTCMRTDHIGPTLHIKLFGGKWISVELTESTESTESTSCLNYTLATVILFLLEYIQLIALHIYKEMFYSAPDRVCILHMWTQLF